MARSSQPLNVCLVIRHFHPVLAGDSERFRRYAPGLRARGVNLEVVTCRNEPNLPECEVVEGGVRVHRVAAVDPLTGTFVDRLLFEAVLRFLKEKRIDARVVQTTLANTPILPCLWKLRATGCRLVHVSTMVGMEIPKTASVRTRLRHAVCMSPFNRLVVSSQAMLRWSAAMGAGTARMKIITNGVDTTRFHPPADEDDRKRICRQLDLPTENPLILFVGNILPRKGLHLLLESWPQLLRQFPHACLVVVGPASRPTVIHKAEQAQVETYQKRIRDLVAALPPTSVRFVGERADVELFYRACHLFVLPSEQEGMGNVVLEAFASGLPALLTNFVGLPKEEFGIPGTHYQLVERDADAIISSLSALLTNPHHAQSMAAEAQTRVRQELSLENTLDRYACLYHTLNGQPQGR